MSCNTENFKQQRKHTIYNKTHTKQDKHTQCNKKTDNQNTV